MDIFWISYYSTPNIVFKKAAKLHTKPPQIRQTYLNSKLLGVYDFSFQIFQTKQNITVLRTDHSVALPDGVELANDLQTLKV